MAFQDMLQTVSGSQVSFGGYALGNLHRSENIFWFPLTLNEQFCKCTAYMRNHKATTSETVCFSAVRLFFKCLFYSGEL